MLVRLIYKSDVLEILTHEQVRTIESDAAVNNDKVGITGVLYYNRRNFIQVLEGSREAVNRTFQRISRDSRHQKVEILEFKEISERAFYQWNMRYYGEGIVVAPLALKFGLNRDLDLSDLSGESVFKFLRELAEVV